MDSGSLCQFEEKAESQTMLIWLCIPSKSPSPKVSQSLVTLKCAVIFTLMTNAERSSGATS